MPAIRTHSRPARPGFASRLGAAFPRGGVLLALIAVVGLALAAPMAKAQDQDPAAAILAWLHGPEEPALTGLAALAQAGNDEIRILLGMIDKTSALQGPWLARLPRAQRHALLRAPGGISGRSWIALAAERAPLARAWLDLMQVGAGLEVAERLTAMGEARSARAAVLTLASREQLDLGAALPDWLDPELAWLGWATGDAALRADILARVPEDHPQRALMGLPVPEGALAAWLRDNPVAAPLRAVCAAQCPGSETCLEAAYGALGSHPALLMLGSPAASLIPEDEFLASPRGRRAVLRRILLAADARGRGALIERTRALDACLGESLAAENARYRYIRDTTETRGALAD